MDEPKPLEQLTFSELRAEAGETISALIAASGTQIDPTALLRLGYFLACVGEAEFTIRLECWKCNYVWHERNTKGLNSIEYPLHQYWDRVCDKCGNTRWTLSMEREKKS